MLTGLSACVERARDLSAAEGAVVQRPAVLASERHALCDALVDDIAADLRETIHVGFAGAVVAALHRVVEQTEHAVAVVRVVLRRVDPALCRDAVRAAGGFMITERNDIVPQFGQRCGRGGTGKAGPDHDDRVLPLVRRVHQLHVEPVSSPTSFRSDRTVS